MYGERIEEESENGVSAGLGTVEVGDAQNGGGLEDAVPGEGCDGEVGIQPGRGGRFSETEEGRVDGGSEGRWLCGLVYAEAVEVWLPESDAGKAGGLLELVGLPGCPGGVRGTARQGDVGVVGEEAGVSLADEFEEEPDGELVSYNMVLDKDYLELGIGACDGDSGETTGGEVKRLVD